MKYNKEDLTFILYNNRSKKLVEKFLENEHINPFKIIKIESILKSLKLKYKTEEKSVILELNKFELDEDDVLYNRKQVNDLSNYFLENLSSFSKRELEYLENRKISNKYYNQLIGLDKLIKDDISLDITGVSIHPILRKALNGGHNGGILMPLFIDGKLSNIATRRIGVNNIEGEKTLKYSLSCPDIDVWGLDNIEYGNEVWITEGIFDMYSLLDKGLRSVTVSSPYWTSIQLYKLLEKRPSVINIFSDNDNTGITSSFVLSDFFKEYNINVLIWKSKFKDASEAFFEKNENIYNLEEIKEYKLSNELVFNDDFNYTKYLDKRRFK
jgi:hypothetical protein